MIAASGDFVIDEFLIRTKGSAIVLLYYKVNFKVILCFFFPTDILYGPWSKKSKIKHMTPTHHNRAYCNRGRSLWSKEITSSI